MFKPHTSRRAANYCLAAAACALAAVFSSQAVAQTVMQLAPAQSVKKVVNGKFAAQVDNGWVIYQGLAGQPTLNFYDTDTSGSFKLKTTGNGLNGNGLLFDAGGIVFGPCPVAAAPVRCQTNNDTGLTGVGIGFGQATFGGAGGQAGGWVNDSSLSAYLTNPNQAPGSIAALAIDPVNGAYAVGWDLNLTSFKDHATITKLDSAGQTYKPISQVDLGTLGGAMSQALGISKNAKYVVGLANTAANKIHAVYALSTATAWTDITPSFPAGVIKSRALAASDTGFIAGSATVKRLVNGKSHSVDIGFVFNTADSGVKFFEAPGFNVKPLKVLADGRVVGNLEQIGSGAIKATHPFLFNGTSLVDFGTMVMPTTGQPAFGCRVNRPNNLGELAGSCIPNGATQYGVGGAAFFLDANTASPAFVDVNAAIHANADANTTGLAPYVMGSVSSIDDAHEITVMGVKLVSGTPNLAAFLVSKPAYNP
jgi:hypothetical protein